MNTHAQWKQFSDDYLKFEDVKSKMSQRPDLHAFMWLDRRFPGGKGDIVSASEHDEIYLDVTSEQIAQLTDNEVRDLVRCGVGYDSGIDSLCMFT
jgi:hypothetical protein